MDNVYDILGDEFYNNYYKYTKDFKINNQGTYLLEIGHLHNVESVLEIIRKKHTVTKVNVKNQGVFRKRQVFFISFRNDSMLESHISIAQDIIRRKEEEIRDKLCSFTTITKKFNLHIHATNLEHNEYTSPELLELHDMLDRLNDDYIFKLVKMKFVDKCYQDLHTPERIYDN